MDRRTFLWASCGVLAAGSAWAIAPDTPLRRAIRAAEEASGGRLGVAVLDTGSGRRFAWRGDERFPMCSTFKLTLVAAILHRVDRGEDRLDRRVPVTARDILNNSPVSKAHVGGAATVATLCEATITQSDNTAANLLLPAVGGPAGLTRFIRSLGDAHTRLDRNEPSIGTATPGDPRDTTTPVAMLELIRRLLLGNVLSPASRRQLTDWAIANRTGDHRLRAGLPSGWRVGDKTGAGDHGTTNDIAILWPPRRPPLLVTSYLTGSSRPSDGRDAVLAAVARAVVAAFV
jgi:beta-lactamase class A